MASFVNFERLAAVIALVELLIIVFEVITGQATRLEKSFELLKLLLLIPQLEACFDEFLVQANGALVYLVIHATLAQYELPLVERQFANARAHSFMLPKFEFPVRSIAF